MSTQKEQTEIPILKKERPDDIFLKGEVEKISFYNEENGFCVLRITPSSKLKEKVSTLDNSITVIGVTPLKISAGASIIARGKWHTHQKFGKQFKAYSITETLPTTEDSIINYLSSSAIKGFGKVLAKRVVNAFGAETLKILDNDIKRLKEVNGIGKKKLEEIENSWKEKKSLREVLLFFQNYNISLSLAQRIYQNYKKRAIEKVKQNPYILSKDIRGIGFKTADNIASSLGIELDSPNRIRAGTSYILKRSSDDGHCYLPENILISKTLSLLKLTKEEAIKEQIALMALEGEIYLEEDKVYTPKLYAAESFLCSSISKRINQFNTPEDKIDEDLINSIVESKRVVGEGRYQKTITLSSEQQEAVRLAAKNSLVVITGGPGCGKTTVIQTIMKLFKQSGLSVKLAAPTGRASQRLEEVCNSKASTIHRLLKFDPSCGSFLHDEDTPLPDQAFIIDEASMIDVLLAASLFRAIPEKKRVVIVGDSDQLPSVGPGRVLSDLLNIKKVSRVKLKTLFRRQKESSITNIAHQINSSIIPEIPTPDGHTKSDSYFLPCKDTHEGASLIERLVIDQIPKKFGIKGSDIMVLSPMNNGELGIISLNKRLQNKIVPHKEGVSEVKVGDSVFRVGDRVIQRTNNYNLGENGVYNGDQGEIIGIDPTKQSIYVKLWDEREIEYDESVIYQLNLAYALTIHRSQGTEVSAVVLALHDSHHILLERQLIYTAITRAKKLLIIVGTKTALQSSIKRTRSAKRYTSLIEKVAKETI